MSWFSKKTKINVASAIGLDAGETIYTELKLLLTMDHFSDDDNFTPPQGFFQDHYIAGFCMGAVTCYADISNAKRKYTMNQMEKYDYAISAYGVLVGEEEVSEYNKLLASIQEKPDFQNGKLVGRALIVSMAMPAAFTKVVDQDAPFVIAALQRAKELETLAGEVETLAGEVDAQTTTLGLALRQTSIGAYINTKFLS